MTKAKLSKASPPVEQLTDQEADEIFQSYRRRKAVMTKKHMYEFEAAVRQSNTTDNFGQARRTALAILTVPCKKLFRDIEKERDTAVACADAERIISSYADRLRELSGLVEEAHRRLMIGLAGRTDMTEIVEQVSHG